MMDHWTPSGALHLYRRCANLPVGLVSSCVCLYELWRELSNAAVFCCKSCCRGNAVESSLLPRGNWVWNKHTEPSNYEALRLPLPRVCDMSTNDLEYIQQAVPSLYLCLMLCRRRNNGLKDQVHGYHILFCHHRQLIRTCRFYQRFEQVTYMWAVLVTLGSQVTQLVPSGKTRNAINTS